MRMMEKDVLELLNIIGVITDGHIVHASGLHGEVYVKKDKIFPNVQSVFKLCWTIARIFSEDHIRVVVGQGPEGATMAYCTAFRLSVLTGREVHAIYVQTGASINEYFGSLISGKGILLVSDVMTADNSAAKIISEVRTLGGIIIGLGVFCKYINITQKDLGVPKLAALANMDLNLWEKDNCPLCQQGVPITQITSDQEFLIRAL